MKAWGWDLGRGLLERRASEELSATQPSFQISLGMDLCRVGISSKAGKSPSLPLPGLWQPRKASRVRQRTASTENLNLPVFPLHFSMEMKEKPPKFMASPSY